MKAACWHTQSSEKVGVIVSTYLTTHLDYLENRQTSPTLLFSAMRHNTPSCKRIYLPPCMSKSTRSPFPHLTHRTESNIQVAARSWPLLPQPQCRFNSVQVLFFDDMTQQEQRLFFGQENKLHSVQKTTTLRSEILTPGVRNDRRGAFCLIWADWCIDKTIPDHDFLSAFETITPSRQISHRGLPKIELGKSIIFLGASWFSELKAFSTMYH